MDKLDDPKGENSKKKTHVEEAEVKINRPRAASFGSSSTHSSPLNSPPISPKSPKSDTSSQDSVIDEPLAKKVSFEIPFQNKKNPITRSQSRAEMVLSEPMSNSSAGDLVVSRSNALYGRYSKPTKTILFYGPGQVTAIVALRIAHHNKECAENGRFGEMINVVVVGREGSEALESMKADGITAELKGRGDEHHERYVVRQAVDSGLKGEHKDDKFCISFIDDSEEIPPADYIALGVKSHHYTASFYEKVQAVIDNSRRAGLNPAILPMRNGMPAWGMLKISTRNKDSDDLGTLDEEIEFDAKRRDKKLLSDGDVEFLHFMRDNGFRNFFGCIVNISAELVVKDGERYYISHTPKEAMSIPLDTVFNLDEIEKLEGEEMKGQYPLPRKEDAATRLATIAAAKSEEVDSSRIASKETSINAIEKASSIGEKRVTYAKAGVTESNIIDPRIHGFGSVFSSSGIDARISGTLYTEIFKKWQFNAVLNPMCAALDSTIKDVMNKKGKNYPLVSRMVGETRLLAHKLNIEDVFDVESLYRRAQNSTNHGTSTSSDFKNGLPLEHDICDAMVRASRIVMSERTCIETVSNLLRRAERFRDGNVSMQDFTPINPPHARTAEQRLEHAHNVSSHMDSIEFADIRKHAQTYSNRKYSSKTHVRAAADDSAVESSSKIARRRANSIGSSLEYREDGSVSPDRPSLINDEFLNRGSDVESTQCIQEKSDENKQGTMAAGFAKSAAIFSGESFLPPEPKEKPDPKEKKEVYPPLPPGVQPHPRYIRSDYKDAVSTAPAVKLKHINKKHTNDGNSV